MKRKTTRNYTSLWIGLGLACVVAGACQLEDDAAQFDSPPPAPVAHSPSSFRSSASLPIAKRIVDLVAPPTELNQAEQSLRKTETQFVTASTSETLSTKAPLPWNDAKLDAQRPVVIMSDAHRKSCKVFVGDPFPDVSLATASGEPVQLREQLAAHAAVVVFWNGQHAASVGLVERLESEVLARHPEICVVAIHTGAATAAFRQAAANERTQARLVHLIDRSGDAFAQVATAMLPRTYVVDANQNVVWLDIEYSRSMRRDRSNAIEFLTGR